MDVIKRFSLIVFLTCSFIYAKNTFSSFTLAPAYPVSSRNAETPTGPKALANGWEAGWTFFGKPFAAFKNGISPLAFGGKISYSRWLRDSTATPVTFLGTEVITRYYLPRFIKPVETFLEGGAGMFIGEYAFTSVDTMAWSPQPVESVVFEGKKNFGFHIGIGLDWDVVEVLPVLTFVNSKDGMSIWLAINAGMTF
jgi:hypothetical protein